LTSSPTPCVPVPRHVVRLVVDYFDYTAFPGASARRAAHHAARRRLHRLCHVSGCLGTSRGSSSTTSTTPCVRRPRQVVRLVTRLVALLVVEFFTYVVRPSALTRRVARRRLLRLCCASGCLGTSSGCLDREGALREGGRPALERGGVMLEGRSTLERCTEVVSYPSSGAEFHPTVAGPIA
jgi:hypothetical protein